MPSQSNGNVTFTVASASWKDVGFDSDLSASVAADEVVKVTINTAAAGNAGIVQPDLESIRGWAFVSESVVAGGQVNAYNTAAGSVVTMFVSASAGTLDAGTTGTVYYATQPQDNTLGDFENSTSIPEINIGMRSEAIVAKTRKLKAVWTPEFAQDLNAYQALLTLKLK